METYTAILQCKGELKEEKFKVPKLLNPEETIKTILQTRNSRTKENHCSFLKIKRSRKNG